MFEVEGVVGLVEEMLYHAYITTVSQKETNMCFMSGSEVTSCY